MGVLDDAIREHLELKRRHGASDEEVEREEVEALGPLRRETAPPSAEREDADAEPAEGEPVPSDEEPEPFSDKHPIELEPEDDLAASRAETVALPGITEEDAPPEPEPEPEFFEPEPEPAAEPEPRVAEPEPSEPAPAEEPARAEEPPEGEDVLEETPDFLQETPEHDRLWFEQRPPRDFDFD
jgi:hypothetical protein